MNIFRSNKLLFLLGAIALIGFCLYEIKDEELRVANVNPKVLYSKSNVSQNGECSNTTINPFSTVAPCPSSLRNKSLFPHASMDAEIDKLVAGDKSKLEVYFEYALRCRFFSQDKRICSRVATQIYWKKMMPGYCVSWKIWLKRVMCRLKYLPQKYGIWKLCRQLLGIA